MVNDSTSLITSPWPYSGSVLQAMTQRSEGAEAFREKRIGFRVSVNQAERLIQVRD